MRMSITSSTYTAPRCDATRGAGDGDAARGGVGVSSGARDRRRGGGVGDDTYSRSGAVLDLQAAESWKESSFVKADVGGGGATMHCQCSSAVANL
ncbi:hypothetical protein ACP70R_001862 [Stipagrostis hirtigluma subsp. patula]